MRFPANGEPFNGQPGSLVLSYHEPATPNPVLMLFLTTCILELATELLQAISGFSFLSAQRNFRSQSAGAGSDARRNVRGSDAPKSIGGSDATFGGMQCTEEHQWTQGAEEHRRTQGWRRSRQVARPGEASGDARPASRGKSLQLYNAVRCEESSLVLRPRSWTRHWVGKSLRSEARGRKSEEILIFLPLASFLLPLIRLVVD